MDLMLYTRVVEAERLDGGVFIAFDDGACGLYPAFVLRSLMPDKVRPLEVSEEDEEDAEDEEGIFGA